MKEINIFEFSGAFAENKDTAKEIRIKTIIPAIENNEEIILNFTGVDGTTQSFIHALISDIIRKYGTNSLEIISFKNCNENIKKIINIVTDYMQEA